MLSACSLRFPLFRLVPGGFGILQMLLQRSNQNLSTILSQSIKIHPKICQNGVQERPGKQLGSKLAQECAPETKLTCFLSPLGWFWAPLWTQLGAKGQNQQFWQQVAANVEKNEVQGGVKKTKLEMLIEIWMEMKGESKQKGRGLQNTVNTNTNSMFFEFLELIF